MTPKTRLTLTCLCLLVAPACADDPSGTAPEIEDLEITPMTVVAGSTTALQGSLRFIDPDADVRDLEITLSPPTGAPSTVEVAITNTADKTEADINFSLAITAPQAGSYEVRVVLIDAEAHRSAASSVEVVATDR